DIEAAGGGGGGNGGASDENGNGAQLEEESKPIPALPENARIIQGDVIDGLKTLPANSVHCVVTSPPYWGLRDYGTGTWEGGDPACLHERPDGQGQCSCGARRVDRQIGLESTPDEFIQKLVAVFREVKRVLHPSGVIWVNIGDSYAGSSMSG